MIQRQPLLVFWLRSLPVRFLEGKHRSPLPSLRSALPGMCVPIPKPLAASDVGFHHFILGYNCWETQVFWVFTSRTWSLVNTFSFPDHLLGSFSNPLFLFEYPILPLSSSSLCFKYLFSSVSPVIAGSCKRWSVSHDLFPFSLCVGWGRACVLAHLQWGLCLLRVFWVMGCRCPYRVVLSRDLLGPMDFRGLGLVSVTFLA